MSVALREWADGAGVTARPEELLGLVSEIETVVQGERSPAMLYPDVLAEVLRRIGDRLGVAVTEADAGRFGGTVGDWPAFPDSGPALRKLSQHFKLIIVSNVDRRSFARSKERLGVHFDRVITAEDVGAYKPRPPHFEALLQSLQEMAIDRDKLLHVAQSLYHDHEPARRHGLQSVWIDRGRDGSGSGATPPPGDAEIRPRWRFPTLEAFADAVEIPA